MNTAADSIENANDLGAEERGVYEVPAAVLAEVVSAVMKANNRLTRHGSTELFTFTAEEFTKTRTREGVAEHAPWVRIALSAPTIAVGDWVFVATLDREDAGFITRTAPGENLDGWTRPEENLCQHCNVARERKRTYVLRHAVTGELKQVGSTCLELFLGMPVHGLWALTFEPVDEAEVSGYDGDRYWSAEQRSYDIRSLLALGWVLSEQGRSFVSRGRASGDYDLTATADAVMSVVFDATSQDTKRRSAAREIYRQAHLVPQETIDDIIGAVDSVEASSDYGQNLRVAVESRYISYRTVGVAVSLITVYCRQIDREIEASRLPLIVDEYLGDKGDKITDITGTVTAVRYFDNSYGRSISTSTMIVIRADSGHQIKWMASKEIDLDRGARVQVSKATVKGHETYNDHAQTVVIRAKLNNVSDDESSG